MDLDVATGMGELGAVAPPSPTQGFPVSGDARQSKWRWPDGSLVNGPDQIRDDAAMLRKLDYPAPDTGNAYDPKFMAAVKAFQQRASLTADGLMGPDTRDALVTAYNISGGSGGGGSALPDGGGGGGGGGAIDLDPDRSSGGGGGLLSNASTGELDVKKVALYGGGALAAIGLAWYLLK